MNVTLGSRKLKQFQSKIASHLYTHNLFKRILDSSSSPPYPPPPLHPKVFQHPLLHFPLEWNSYRQSFFLLNVLSSLPWSSKNRHACHPIGSFLRPVWLRDTESSFSVSAEFSQPWSYLSTLWYALFYFALFLVFCTVWCCLYFLKIFNFSFFMNIRFSFLYIFKICKSRLFIVF